MELLGLIIGLVAFDLLAVRFGSDSRDGSGGMAHGRSASATGWPDSAYDLQLAQELLRARHRRLARSEAASTPLSSSGSNIPRSIVTNSSPPMPAGSMTATPMRTKLAEI